MPLDPSIALQTKPVVLPDPVAAYGNVLQLQGQQQSLRANALAFGQAEQSAAETNALRSRVSQSDFQNLTPQQQIGEIQKVAPIAGQPIVDKMIANRKTLVETNNAVQTNAAAQAKDIAQTVESAKTPADLIKAGYLGAAQGRWDATKFDPIVQHLTSGAITTPEQFATFKQQIGQAVMSPDAQAALSQPDMKPVETGGGTTFVNTKPSAGPVGVPMSPVISGNPKLVTGAQGEQLSVSPDGSSYGAVPVAGQAPSGPQWVGPEPTGNFAGDPNKIRADLSRITNPADRAAALRALDNQTASKNPAQAAGGAAGAYPTTVPPELIAASQHVSGLAPGVKNPYLEQDAKNAGEYEGALNKSVESGRNLMALNAEFQSALKNYQTGPGAPTRLAVATALAGFGVPKDIVEKINRGSIADAQEINKLAAQGAMQSLKQAMDGQGRLSQAEFQVFKANNPNIELDPNAIVKIQKFQADQYSKTFAEQQALSDFKSKGGNPSAWPSIWSQMLNTQGKAQPAARTDAAGTPGGALTPDTPKPAVIRTGKDAQGNKVVQYADGTFGYGGR